MGKFNCCVPKCTNNWRNSPNLPFHSLPKDPMVPAEYNRLIRNETLRVCSQNTKICGGHFVGGERACRTELPSIFPWSKTVKKRREIGKHDPPDKTRQQPTNVEASEPLDLGNNEIDDQRSGGSLSESPSDESMVEQLECRIGEVERENNIQPQDNSETEGLRLKLASIQKELDECKSNYNSVKKELERLQYKFEEEPKFDICQYKDSDEDVQFFTGFPNYASLLLCFDIL